VTEAERGFTSFAGRVAFASGVLENLEAEGVSEPSGFGREEEERTWEDSRDVVRLRG